MSGLFNRIKNWIGLETLTDDDLNKEFNNIIQHFTPEFMDDFSASISQMRQTLNPGGVGTEVPATSLSEELQQLRYMLKSFSGEAQWYSPPESNLAELALLFSPAVGITSGRVDAFKQPMWLVPNGAALSVQLQAASTQLVTSISTFNSDITKSSLTAAPSSNNTALVNQSGLSGEAYSQYLGEGDSVIPIDNIGSEISALNGTRAAFKVGSEFFICDIDTTNGYLKNAYRGFFFDSTDANLGRSAISDNDTLTLMKLTWVFATIVSSVQGLDVTYNQPTVSYDEPATPSAGDYWFDLSSFGGQWKKYSGASFTAIQAIFIGNCLQDSTNCVAARSVDLSKSYSDFNGVEMDRRSNSLARSKKPGAQVSVYGRTFYLDPDFGTWDMATDLDSGVTENASTTYYFYINTLGDRLISDKAPHNRYHDLRGAYHPFRPYRCVGSVYNDGSSNFLSTIGSEKRITSFNAYDLQNAGLRWSIAANALTIELTTADGSDPSAVNPVIGRFRGVTLTDSRHTEKRIENALSLVVPSTATLGNLSNKNSWVSFLLAFDGFRILPMVYGNAIGNQPSGINSTVSVTTLDTSSDTIATYYGPVSGSTTVTALGVGVINSTQVTAGTWAALPTVAYSQLKTFYGNVLSSLTGNGTANHGGTDTRIRRISTDGTTTLSDALGNIAEIVTNSANGTVLTILRSGLYSVRYEDTNSGGASIFGLSLNSASLTTAYASLSASEKLAGTGAAAATVGGTEFVGYLAAGSVVRPHDDGACDSANVFFAVRFLAGL